MVWVSSRRRHAALLTVCLLLTVLLILNNVSPHCEEVRRTSCECNGAQRKRRADTESRLEPRRCLEDVVTVKADGRLGNLAFEYASVWAVARSFGLQLAVPRTILEPLSEVFSNLSAASLEELFQQQYACRGLSLKDVLGKATFPVGNKHVEEIVRLALVRRRPAYFWNAIVLTTYLARNLDDLRREFRFRPEVQLQADEKLAEVISVAAATAGCSRSQVCTVGVHVRRTDYMKHMQKMIKLNEAPGVPYYAAAAAILRRHLQDDCRAVAYLVSTDDARWCEEQLLPGLQTNFTNVSPPSFAFLVSSDSPGVDVCLLSSTDHLVQSYGTFGMLAGVLGGGRSVVYNVSSHGATKPNSPVKFATILPGWEAIP